MDSLLRVLSYLKPYRSLAAATLLFAVLTTLLDLVPPWLIKRIVDFLVDHGNAAAIYWSAAGLALAYLARNVSNYPRIALNNRVEQKVVFDLRSHVYRALQKPSLSYFENRSTGEIMSRVTEDVNNVERIFIDGVEQALTAVLTLLGIAVILFYLHWKLAAAALAPIPLLFLGAWKYTLRAQDLYQTNRERAARLSAPMNSSNSFPTGTTRSSGSAASNSPAGSAAASPSRASF